LEKTTITTHATIKKKDHEQPNRTSKHEKRGKREGVKNQADL